MLLAAFMNLLDVSIVNIAIPPIQHGLHASYADVQRTQDAGSASGVLNTGFQLGNSIGLALMGVIFIDQLTIRPGADVGSVFATAVEHALWFQVGVFGLAFLLMLALPARRGHKTAAATV